MLVFTRHVGETIMVDEDVAVTVLGVENGQVRLGISAPPDAVVVPKEFLLEDESAEAQPDLPMSAPEPH